jgi:hypothetical protein
MQTDWLVVHTRSPTLTAILRERACQGKVYTVWEADSWDRCWISQSIPAIREAVNHSMPASRRLHDAGLYRVLRFECLFGHHKYYRARKWDRRDVAGLAEFLRPFADVAFVTKDPHAWRLRSNATHGLLEEDRAPQ